MFFETSMTGNPKIEWVQWSFSGEDCLLGTLGSPQDLRKPVQKPELRGHAGKPTDTQADGECNRLAVDSLAFLHCI